MSIDLKTFSAALVELIAQAQSSVVRVNARRRIPASGMVWSADRVILTASHAIQREDKITVTLSNGEEHAADLIGRDPTTDVAALRIAAGALSPLPPARTEELKVGHLALALARPGQTVQATLGMISGCGEKWRTPLGGSLEFFLRADINLYPGFSGGPLLTTKGEVLGMNSSALSRHFTVVVPVAALQRVASELLQHGRVRRGYLGIGVQPVDLPANLSQQLNQETGLLVVSVAPDSPAEKHGLLLGDTIVSVAGQPLEHIEQLLASLGGDRIDQEIIFSILRGGQLQEVKAVLGENV